MDAHAESDLEPFGQRGILPYIWPTFVILCAIGIATSVLMHNRSGNTWDSVISTTPNRQVIVASVIGRLVIDIIPTTTNHDIPSSSWDFDSRLFESIQDGWSESWKKTIGVEWGYETARRFNQQPLTYWRLRVRWRTLTILYSIPVMIELGKRLRKRFHKSAAVHDEMMEPTA